MTKGCNGSSVTQSVYIIVEDVPLDHGGSLHQHHHLQAVRPSSVEPSPQQSVALTKPRAARPLPMENGQLMPEGQPPPVPGRHDAETGKRPERPLRTGS